MKRYFITGLLVVIPVYLTFYVLWVIVRFLDSFVYALPVSINPDTYLPAHIYGLGIVATAAGVFLVGVVATNFLGKKLVAIGEGMLERIPVLRTVYSASKQFIETFFTRGSDGFKNVVLVEFPRKGVYSIGFVTSRTKGEVQDKTKEDVINVFVPTTPNPTSGFYFAVPEQDVIPLDMGVEDAFKMIISGGLIVPEKGKDKKQTGSS
ncbi:MAG: DUF502 domain-containing protein [Deltaproteobacteria bacterium]|nr:DUF502 domain-containing protein [Deltaproteobacteria bacterium]